MSKDETRTDEASTTEALKEALLQRLLAQALRGPDEETQAAPARTPREPQRDLDQLRAHIRALLSRTYEFAAAVGACPCFGHPDCRRCNGRGLPGWHAPKEAAFLAYVAPALHRIGLLVEDEATDDGTRGEDNDAVRI